ncbi:ectoine hydroxylase [Haloglycomyces albus]|uniref:ectoine hydroxylase n=1 Tax=Haloglycomyces albus TaxID=526067 RepID=UPI00046D186D|nr:ectoine hydroxylase [Haloglycomyces albus]
MFKEALIQTRDYYPTRIEKEPRLIYRSEDPVVWGNSDDGPLNTDQLNNHENNGYTSIDSLIEGDDLTSAQNELQRLMSEPSLADDERVIREPKSNQVRSVFDVHKLSDFFSELIREERIAGVARQLLGSDVYLHQSRVNYKPGFGGKSFYWHSDFETWHAEDGMPRMRAVSLSISLTDNYEYNGSLMIMPGSHTTFVSCVGATPEDNYHQSLQAQKVGTPDETSLRCLADKHGIDQLTGKAGSGLWFDSNCMHGSGGNITPYPRSNLFLVFNSVENELDEPFGADKPRPEFLGARTWDIVK